MFLYFYATKIKKLISIKRQRKIFAKKELTKKDFSKIYETHYDKVLSFVKKRVTNDAVAEDLTSEIFEKVLISLADFQWQGITVSAWIFKIARNHIIDYYRKNEKYKGDKSLEDVVNFIESNIPSVDIEAEADEEEVELYNALRNLDEQEQYLIFYKFFEELSNKQIAELLNISETNVGTKLHRSRKKLERIIQKNQKRKTHVATAASAKS